MSSDSLPVQWVAPRLSNGLGNRLFQFANAKNMADIWSMPLVFAMNYVLPSEHGDFESIFKMFPLIPKVWKAEPQLCVEHNGVSAFQYIPLPPNQPSDTVLLKGSWITAKYLPETMEPNWKFAVPGSEELLERWNLSSKEQQEKTVFLHVRLGDYCVLPHHQVPLLGYYAKAMAAFPEDTRFLIFSDEPEKARTLPVFHGQPCVFVSEKDELKSLYLMTMCSGGITANSTFSYWGAYFGRERLGETYKCYMPSRWMATDEKTEDLYPSWATRIDT
uniref:Glycosyltransferase n=1 Tax=viral metagenome TaxID=1070528 RepID=A0A6C0K869_9ZZZZ